VAVDTDNTGEPALTYFGDLALLPAGPNKEETPKP
jgi:hypothetical protein